jgi:putative tryptophan/tyrosine transport system substrate-binding protein
MRRRQFIGLLGGAAAAWPLAARAQQSAGTLVGFLHNAPANGLLHIVEAVREGISAAGPDGANVKIESRWAEGQYDRLPALAAALVRLQPEVIVAGSHVSALAAKAATQTIPIVFVTGGDPVRDGLVGSLSRPGSNATGLTLIAGDLGPKRLELMRELVPQADLIAVLKNTTNPTLAAELHDLEGAAQAMGQKLLILDAATPQAIDEAFVTLVQQRAGALLITVDATFNARRNQLIALAARHAVPAMYYAREFVSSGGLISYGTDLTETYRKVGEYVARILQGAKPADLPVQRPTKFQLVINLATAKALGLTVSRTMRVHADEVIN